MAQVLSFVNHKGGTGKTTSAINVGAALAEYQDKKVLLVDLDPQANLTTHAGFFEEPELSIYEVLQGEASVEQAILHRRPFDLLPSKLDLSGCELTLIGRTAREFILAKLLKPILPLYDVVIIDCPPSLGLLTVNALAASDWYYVPMQTEFFALQGLSKILNEIVIGVKENLNERLQLGGIFGVMFDKRRSLHTDVLDSAREEFKDRMCETVVRVSTSLSDASADGKTIFEYDASSRGAEDYVILANEIAFRSKL